MNEQDNRVMQEIRAAGAAKMGEYSRQIAISLRQAANELNASVAAVVAASLYGVGLFVGLTEDELIADLGGQQDSNPLDSLRLTYEAGIEDGREAGASADREDGAAQERRDDNTQEPGAAR